MAMGWMNGGGGGPCQVEITWGIFRKATTKRRMKDK